MCRAPRISFLPFAIRPHRGRLVVGVGFLLLASMPGLAQAQPLPERLGAHGLALQWRAVATSGWTARESVAPVLDGTAISVPFREKAAYGLGLEVAYGLGHGLAPFVAADFDLQEIRGQFGGFSDYGTVSAGIRVRHPISRRIVPFAEAAVTRLRVASPVYTQPYLGAGTEFFIGRRVALSAALELPVFGSSSLDKSPHRFFLGTSWHLGR